MKRFTHRFLSLALCCTLTLGAFAYRPPQAEAVAGVDDAIVIGALLTAFAGGCGLIFSNNGMTSRQIADGMAQKWYEFNESAQSGAETFAGWLGYDDISALLADCKLKAGNILQIPRAVAQKFADFTGWFIKDTGITSDGASQPVCGMPACITVNGYTLTYNDFPSSITDYDRSSYLPATFSNLVWYPVRYLDTSRDEPYYPFGSGVKDCYFYFSLSAGQVDCYCRYGMGDSSSALFVGKQKNGEPIGDYKRLYFAAGYSSIGFWSILTDNEIYRVTYTDLTKYPDALSKTPLAPYWGNLPTAANDLRAGAPSGVQTPDIAGDKADPVDMSGVGDGTATTVEELLQQILEQLQTNTLAPTLTVDGTQTGGNTGTDTGEDAKPYLPYIPQIFEKIKDIPGTLSSIWETIKSIPAAVAEKIGAFFTTLWDWLQNIIDAIKAVPAAIAEAVGALFKPDEALVAEITDTFKGKFGFLSTLNSFVTDLFGMSAETEPPVIWVHLEDAESKYGYVYGDKQKMLDLSWYQKYKASVDGLLSGFLWLGYLWLLFKRAPGILNGMSLEGGLLPPLQTGGDVSDAPRIGSGNPSMHYGDGFTFRDKGGRRR